jgi:hypothetical protein
MQKIREVALRKVLRNLQKRLTTLKKTGDVWGDVSEGYPRRLLDLPVCGWLCGGSIKH